MTDLCARFVRSITASIKSPFAVRKINELVKGTRVYVDLETTGLGTYKCQIIQIAACTDNNMKKFERWIVPTIPIESEASKVTGITMESLSKLEKENKTTTLEKSLSDFSDWLKMIDDPITLIAYNGFAFDFMVLINEMIRSKVNPVDFFAQSGVTMFVDPYIFAKSSLDTTSLVRNNHGKPSFKLGDIHSSLLGKHIDGAHNAVADTEGLSAVCNHELFKGLGADKNSTKDVAQFCMRIVEERKRIQYLNTLHMYSSALKLKSVPLPSILPNESNLSNLSNLSIGTKRSIDSIDSIEADIDEIVPSGKRMKRV